MVVVKVVISAFISDLEDQQECKKQLSSAF